MSGIHLMLVGSGPGRVVASATISSDTSNYTVNTAKASGYVAGNTDFTLTINSGIFVSSSSTGSYALTIDNSWSAGDTVTIINNGTIIGRGGNGGDGGRGNVGFPGAGGGPAILAQFAVAITNNSRVSGGGGGGGGGGFSGPRCGGGGGGGIGVSNGGRADGPGYTTATPGTGGTLTTAGSGGSGGSAGKEFSGSGGNGGSYGNSGSNGGAATPGGGGLAGGGGGSAGACTQGGPTYITWTVAGTRNGALN